MENNKRIGRRFIIGGSAILLISVAFYYIIETFKHNVELLQIAQNIFGNYTSSVLIIVGFIAGTLTVTDAIFKKINRGKNG